MSVPMEDKIARFGFTIIILTIIALSIGGFFINKCTQATHVKDAVIIYEEYQDVYNSCIKINEDLCSIKDIPDDDKMFEQISKQQRISALKSNLNRWINEYNSKSRMWGRQLWKSSSLPYELNVNQFNCY